MNPEIEPHLPLSLPLPLPIETFRQRRQKFQRQMAPESVALFLAPQRSCATMMFIIPFARTRIFFI